MRSLLGLGASLALVCSLKGGSLEPSTPGTPREMALRLQESYQGLNSFRARFQQVFRGPFSHLRESGILAMKKPGKMYWEYREPKQKYFVSDGHKAYFYVPGDRQVMVTDLRADTAQTPVLFLLGQGDILKEFEVSWEEEDLPLEDSNLLLRLVPKTPQAEFSYLLLELLPDSLLIRRLAVVEPLGNRNDYILTDFEKNPDLPDKLFEFKIPQGVEVLHP